MLSDPDDPFDRSEFFGQDGRTNKRTVSPDYPLIYPVSTGWKRGLLVLGIVILLLSVTGAIYWGYSHQIKDDTIRLVLIGISAAFSLLGAYCIAVAYLTRVTLQHDAIEYREPLRKIRVMRHEIDGYRFRTAKGITYLELFITSEGGVRRIALLFDADQEFAAWFAGLADINEEQYQAAYNAIIEDVTLGDTPEERLARTMLARRWTEILGVVSNLLVAAVLFISHPLLTIVLLSLPLLAIEIARRFGNAVSVLEDEADSMRGNIFTMIFMTAIGLMIVALKMSNLEDWANIISPSLVAGVLMLAVMFWVAPRIVRFPGKFAVLGVCFSLYSASTLAIANVYFDDAPPDDVMLDVTGKFIRESRSGTHYYLLVLPWGTTKPAEEINVNDEFYQHIQPGQEVCIHNHAGKFGIPWYEVSEALDCNRSFGGPG